MAYVIAYAVQRTGVDRPATVEAIKRAFLRVQRVGNTSPAAARPLQLGEYVGPNPRITRETQVSLDLGGGQYTRAAWLHELPDPVGPLAEQVRRDQLQRLRDQLLDNLRREAPGGTWDASILGYNPDFNGSVEWWRSGRAATEATYINTWPGFRTGDNPIGPNDTDPVQGVDLSPPLVPPLPRLTGGANWAPLLWGAAAVLALVYLGPGVGSALSAATAKRRR